MSKVFHKKTLPLENDAASEITETLLIGLVRRSKIKVRQQKIEIKNYASHFIDNELGKIHNKVANVVRLGIEWK